MVRGRCCARHPGLALIGPSWILSWQEQHISNGSEHGLYPHFMTIWIRNMTWCNMMTLSMKMSIIWVCSLDFQISNPKMGLNYRRAFQCMSALAQADRRFPHIPQLLRNTDWLWQLWLMNNCWLTDMNSNFSTKIGDDFIFSLFFSINMLMPLGVDQTCLPWLGWCPKFHPGKSPLKAPKYHFPKTQKFEWNPHISNGPMPIFYG